MYKCMLFHHLSYCTLSHMLHYLHFSYTFRWHNNVKSFFINFRHLSFSTYIGNNFFVYLVFTNSYLINITNFYELVSCYKSRYKFCYLYKYITLDNMVINV